MSEGALRVLLVPDSVVDRKNGIAGKIALVREGDSAPIGARVITLDTKKDRRDAAIRLAAASDNELTPDYIESCIDELYAEALTSLQKPDSTTPRLRLNETLNDSGNAERLVAMFGDRIRFVPETETWVAWNGKRWEPDSDGALVRLAQESARHLFRLAAEEESDDRAKRIADFAGKSLTAYGLRSALEVARVHPQILAHLDTLDSNPWLLCCGNGTVDLKTGTLYPHRKEDLITRWTPVRYNADATHPVWTNFLKDVTRDDPDFEAFLQRAVGYSATADLREEKFLFLFGPHRTGKSTFIEAIIRTLGEHVLATKEDTWLQKRDSGGPRSDLARLVNCRVVVCSEISRGARLDMALVKSITGGDPLTVAPKHKDDFQFQPRFTLWFASNYPPHMDSSDGAIWRRAHILPFENQIPAERVNEGLKESLRHDPKLQEAILAWIVRGAQAWARNSLGAPRVVLEATGKLRRSMDPLLDFYEDCCVFLPDLETPRVNVWNAYKKWASDQGEKPRKKSDFYQYIEAREGVKAKRTAQTEMLFGVGLVSEGAFYPESVDPNPVPDEKLTQNVLFEADSENFLLTRTRKENTETGQKSTFLHTEHTQADSFESGPGIAPPHAPAVVVITDPAELDSLLASIAGQKVGIDLETTGLNPRRDVIRLVQIALEDVVFVVDCNAVGTDWIGSALASVSMAIGHNLKFDLGFVLALGHPFPPQVFDTFVAAQLLHAGETGVRFSLKAVAERYLGIAVDKTEQTSDWSGDLTPEQIEYAAKDASILLPLASVLAKALNAANLIPIAQLEYRALLALTWMEHAGVPFHSEAWAIQAEVSETKRQSLALQLSALAGTVDMFGDGATDWDSPAQVKRLLTARGHEVTATDEAALLELAESEPLVPLLLEYREASKSAGTYGVEFIVKFDDPVTHRIHASYKQCHTAAGRMSCERPNMQQIPRSQVFRSCFAAPEGRVLVVADYSQIELRIAAELSGDRAMTRAYKEGADVHRLTAAAALNIPPGDVTKDQRQLAKALNFGLIYGMGAPKLVDHAWNNYRVRLTPEEAVKFRERFFKTYPQLRQWHSKVGRAGDEPTETRTLGGRRRVGVTKFTERLNSPVQGTGADGMKAAVALLWETRDRYPSAVPVLCVHDELVVECDEADGEGVARWLEECMVDGMKQFLKRVPVEVEAHVVRHWGEK